MENSMRKLIPQIIGIIIVLTTSILSRGHFFSLVAGLSLVFFASDKKNPPSIRISSAILGGVFIFVVVFYYAFLLTLPTTRADRDLFGFYLPYSDVGRDLGLW